MPMGATPWAIVSHAAICKPQRHFGPIPYNSAMTNDPAISWETALANIAARAQDVDQSGAWPAHNLVDLNACGAMRWSIPSIYGGVGLGPLDLQKRYAQ